MLFARQRELFFGGGVNLLDPTTPKRGIPALYATDHTKMCVFWSVFDPQKMRRENVNNTDLRIPPRAATYHGQRKRMATVLRTTKPCPNEPGRSEQRDRRGASDEVVCALAHASGFESAGATTAVPMRQLSPASAPEPPERAARRARALEKVS